MVNVGMYVPVAALFPEVVPALASLRSLLARLSRTDVVFWCARLNHVLSGTSGFSHEERQAFGLRHFCTTAQLRLVDEFCASHSRTTGDVTVFFRGQLLELLRWATLYCDDQPYDGTTFDDPTTREAFLQACLIAGECWSQRVYGNAFDLDDGVDVARQRILGPVRKGIDGSAVAGEWSQHLGRGYQLFCQ